MKLFKEIKEYIEKEGEFDEDLAIEISNFQLKNNQFYRSYAKKLGIKRIKNLEEIPFLPVEFFKTFEIFSLKKKDGYFVSSGTGGNRSTVYYNRESLELYEISALKSFPFKDKMIYSLIPPFSIAKTSSLSFMIHLFYKNFKVEYLNEESFDIDGGLFARIIKEKVEDNSILFLTSLQLFKLIHQTEEEEIENKIIIIETGGYKAIKRKYRRRELYKSASRIFPNAEFLSEYGMAELFSQFYTVSPNKNYIFKHYNYVFSKKRKDILRLFDFANLGTVSALLVPDLIVRKGIEFDVKGRLTSEIRGCGYVFR